MGGRERGKKEENKVVQVRGEGVTVTTTATLDLPRHSVRDSLLQEILEHLLRPLLQNISHDVLPCLGSCGYVHSYSVLDNEEICVWLVWNASTRYTISDRQLPALLKNR